MPKRNTDELFQLVKSLEKSEKRNFKLFVKRMSGSDDLKSVLLFDTLDKMDEFDEEVLLKKNPQLKKQQLSNMKAHLYRQILSSLRLLKNDENVEMWLNEQMAYARLLYNKGLYMQSLKLLTKIKSFAYENNQLTFVLQSVLFEKKIESMHITRSFEDRAQLLSNENELVNEHLRLQGFLSNLSLQMYSWYIKMGAARDAKEVAAVKWFFESNLPKLPAENELNFFEKLYLFQSQCWYAFILQDYKSYYKNAYKWVELFDKDSIMQKTETLQYIKGYHNLLSALFLTDGYYEKFDHVLQRFESFAEGGMEFFNMNIRIQVFVYLNLARINKYFLNGTFEEGLALVPEIVSQIDTYKLYLDKHRILIFYYKIACLYFGSGDNETTIDYLNKIINDKFELRTDLQCYARLLHLIAHYELGNYDILEYLIKSVYRFMSKMQTFTVVEDSIFKFLRQTLTITDKKKIESGFKILKAKLEKFEGDPFEARSFSYLDIISWLESRIKKIPVAEVRKRKMLAATTHSKING